MLDLGFIRDNWLFIAMGIGTTLGLAIFSFLPGAAIGMIVAKGRRSARLPLRALSTFYVWLIDGLPLLVQLLFVFLVLPSMGIVLPGFAAGVLVMTVNSSARMSKVFYERTAATGRNQGENRSSFIAPLANELSDLMKDSTIISVAGFVHEVFWRATKVGRTEFHMPEALLIAAIIYLTLFTIVSLGSKALRRMSVTGKAGTEASA